MPTYSYKCVECGHAFDIHQSFSDDALTTCPECGGELRKVFGSVGVTFKGSGFYRTDSRAASTGGKKDAASGSDSKPPSTDAKSPDSKSPEKKSSENKSAEKKSAEKKSASSGSTSTAGSTA